MASFVASSRSALAASSSAFAASPVALDRLQLRAQLRDALAQRLRLRAAREDRALFAEATAGDGAAAHDLIPVERDDRVAEALAARERDAGAQLVDHQDAADEERDDPAVARLRAHQRVRVADHAGPVAQVAQIAALALRERVERQEGRAAELALAQVRDRGFGVFGRLRDHVGQPRAERDVERARVALVGGDQVRDDAVQAAQQAALRRFDDGLRAVRVAFERRFELFDRVQARLGARDLRRDLAMAALQVGHARRGSLAVLARDPGALALRGRFGFVARDQQLALAEPPARLVGGLRVLVALGERVGVLALEPLDIGARGVDLRAPLRCVRRAFRRERFNRAQLLVHRVERAARGGHRLGRRELALARAVGLRTQRREPFVERRDRLAQRLALALDAVAVGDDGVGLALQPVAARDRRGEIGFDARELRARGLRVRPMAVQLQLQRVERLAQRRDRRAELRRARGGRGALVLVLLELRRDALALGAARGRRAQVREDLQVAHARGHLAVAFRAAHLRVELRHAALQFRDEVVHADRVLLGGFEPPQRLVLAREKLADAGGLFEQRAPFGGLGGQDRVDLALRHDRVRTRAEARAHQQLVHVAQPHRRAVDVELRLARRDTRAA